MPFLLTGSNWEFLLVIFFFNDFKFSLQNHLYLDECERVIVHGASTAKGHYRQNAMDNHSVRAVYDYTHDTQEQAELTESPSSINFRGGRTRI